jgi:tetratricopeptide (TPR) repeat protein
MTQPRSLRGLAALATLCVLCSCAGSSPGGSGAAPVPEDPDAALESARAALGADPSDTEARFRMGLAWQRKADAVAGAAQKSYRDSAFAAYEGLLQQDPDNVEALVHSALVLEDLGRPEDALARYEKASELAPDDPLPLINRGSLLYFQFKRTYEAKEALTRALELDPGNADAHFNLGVLFADANLFGEAKLEWEKVLELADEGSPARTLAEENLERIRPLVEDSPEEVGSSGAPATEEGG